MTEVLRGISGSLKSWWQEIPAAVKPSWAGMEDEDEFGLECSSNFMTDVNLGVESEGEMLGNSNTVSVQ